MAGNILFSEIKGKEKLVSFTSRSRIFHLYVDVTTAGEGHQKIGPRLAPRAPQQARILIVPHGTPGFTVSSEGPPHSVASYDTLGDVEDLL